MAFQVNLGRDRYDDEVAAHAVLRKTVREFAWDARRGIGRSGRQGRHRKLPDVDSTTGPSASVQPGIARSLRATSARCVSACFRGASFWRSMGGRRQNPSSSMRRSCAATSQMALRWVVESGGLTGSELANCRGCRRLQALLRRRGTADDLPRPQRQRRNQEPHGVH